MVFFLIPVFAWLSSATLGGILTVFAGGFLLSWLVAHIIVPICIILGLLGVGLLIVFFGVRAKGGFAIAGIGAGCLMFILAIAMWGQYFGNFVLIPGLLSVGGTAQTYSIIGGNAVSTVGVTLLEPIKWVVIGIVIATLIMVYREHKGGKK